MSVLDALKKLTDAAAEKMERFMEKDDKKHWIGMPPSASDSELDEHFKVLDDYFDEVENPETEQDVVQRSISDLVAESEQLRQEDLFPSSSLNVVAKINQMRDRFDRVSALLSDLTRESENNAKLAHEYAMKAAKLDGIIKRETATLRAIDAAIKAYELEYAQTAQS